MGRRLRTEFIRRRNDPNLIYIPEFGSELSEAPPDGFAQASEPETVSEIDLDFYRVIVEDSETVETSMRRFGRLRLENSGGTP